MALTQLIDERRFPRIGVGVKLHYSVASVDKNNREYLRGIARDASFGGMFIATEKPAPRGTVIQLEFTADFDKDEPPVRSTAIVRWTRKFLHPRGMGIEFIDFEGLGDRHFQTWMEQLTTTG